MTTKEIVAETKGRVERAADILRRIIGVPDYERYVAHLHAHYPDATPMCQRDFDRQRMTDKYTRPGGRCC